MITAIPRVMVAGTSSGCGKTTIVCGILAALCKKQSRPAAYKCGPDYIDPMFHTAVLELESTNLDPFFADQNLLNYLLAKNFAGAGIAVVEGVMGYYDGTGATGTENSSYTVAVKTSTPVVLVVNGKGASTSVLATIKGFFDFAPNSCIAGVIINNVTTATYERLKAQINSYFADAILPMGYLPKLPDGCVLESRHLGLVTAQEIPNIKERIDKIAEIVTQTVDLDMLTALARTAQPLEYTPVVVERMERVKIAVARDNAFCFYYKANLDLLREMGAELEFFSPLANEPVPNGACGLLIGGGYPELYLEKLGESTVSGGSIKAAICQKMPTIAECGGFMYLGRAIDGSKMCGAMDASSKNCGKLVRFGYLELTANRDGIFGEAGTLLRAHEFHYYDSTDNGSGFTARRTNGATYPCAHLTDSLYAGYPHIYFYSNPQAAAAFYKKCIEWKACEK